MTPTIYLMDASAFIHRAFHAIRNLTNKKNQPTGAIYGFTATLLKLLREKTPEYLAVVFDHKGPGRRHQLYPGYKANRPPMDKDLAAQQSYIREITNALGLFSLEETGFEADDIIAQGARFYADLGYQVIIVSGDKDFYQLLSDQISMYDPDPKKDAAPDAASFQTRFGLSPKSFLEMQALMGDSSDNIPGVPKVGEKTAQKLILQFHSLDELYERLEEVKPETLKEKLRAHREDAYLSRRLAYLGEGYEFSLPKEKLRPNPFAGEKLLELFTELDFQRLIKDFQLVKAKQPGTAIDAVPASPQTLFDNLPGKAEKISYEQYTLVDNIAGPAWQKMMSELKSAKKLAVDLETDSPSPSRANIVGLSLCARPGVSFYVAIDHQTLGAKNVSWADFKREAGPFLEEPAIPKIGQNAKFDWLILSRFGLTLPPPQDDPMLAAYLLNPEGRHGLDALSLKYLGHEPISFKSLVPDPKKSHFGHLSPEEAKDYGAEDADLTLRLAEILRTNLSAHENLLDLYENLELPLEDLLARMEGYGVLVDQKALAVVSADLNEKLHDIEAKVFSLAGHQFNIGSPKQLSEILFNELGLPTGKKTGKKTGFSTDDSVLADLAPLHPLAFEVRRWKALDKLKSTYADKLPKTINPVTGRIHTSYNQILTATGRLSSSDPNLQNIPIKSEEGRRIREAFVAPAGYSLIAADYSQIELRILAHFSQDRALLAAFENDEDIHRQTASEIFAVPLADVSAEQRREAKTINFGVVYGQGPFGLARQLGVPQAQARDFIERYFQRFPGVKKYMDDIKTQAEQDGFVETWYGRRRFLPAMTQGGYQARQEALRMAINTPIQGTAADIIKMAMLKVYARLAAEAPQSRLIMQVHDELVVECPTESVAQVTEILQGEMEGAARQTPLKIKHPPIRTPLKVEISHGPHWAK